MIRIKNVSEKTVVTVQSKVGDGSQAVLSTEAILNNREEVLMNLDESLVIKERKQ